MDGGRLHSEKKVDLHVLIVPASLWRADLRFAYNSTCLESISLGFVRVHPDISLCALRDQIARQLDLRLLPALYVFLRNVGRHLAWVSPQQESSLRTKLFVPPLAPCPELYILNAKCLGESLPPVQKHRANPPHGTYTYNEVPYSHTQQTTDIESTSPAFHMHPVATLDGNHLSFQGSPSLCHHSDHDLQYLQRKQQLLRAGKRGGRSVPMPYAARTRQATKMKSRKTHASSWSPQPTFQYQSLLHVPPSSQHYNVMHPAQVSYTSSPNQGTFLCSSHSTPKISEEPSQHLYAPQQVESSSEVSSSSGTCSSDESSGSVTPDSDLPHIRVKVSPNDPQVLKATAALERMLYGDRSQRNSAATDATPVQTRHYNPRYTTKGKQMPSLRDGEIGRQDDIPHTKQTVPIGSKGGTRKQMNAAFTEAQAPATTHTPHEATSTPPIQSTTKSKQMPSLRDGEIGRQDDIPHTKQTVPKGSKGGTRKQMNATFMEAQAPVTPTHKPHETTSIPAALQNSGHYPANKITVSQVTGESKQNTKPLRKGFVSQKSSGDSSKNVCDSQHTKAASENASIQAPNRGTQEKNATTAAPLQAQSLDGALHSVEEQLHTRSKGRPRKRTETYPPKSRKIFDRREFDFAQNKLPVRFNPAHIMPPNASTYSPPSTTLPPTKNHLSPNVPLPPIPNSSDQTTTAHTDTDVTGNATANLSEVNDLLAQIRIVKQECQELNAAKTNLAANLRNLHSTLKSHREVANREWKRKFFHEKKLTSSLEDNIKKVKNEMQHLQAQLDHKREVFFRDASIHTPTMLVQAPSAHSNIKIQCRRHELTIQELKQRQETTKQKLAMEKEAHQAVEAECKALRKKLTEKKIACTRTSGHPVAI